MRLSMDIGGTFTDIVLHGPGGYRTTKVLTTPGDLSEGVREGVRRLVDDLHDVELTVHGTTAGLNAFLERRGERVLLLATRGVGDVYHIARGHRRDIYAIRYRKPEPLVPRSDIVEVGGRLDWAGREVEPLDLDAVRAAGARARDEGYGAIAVCLLFSYVEPAHELEVERVLQEVAPGLSVSLSHRVARQWREYERTSSTVLEAYVAPTVRRYLERLERGFAEDGLRVPVHVMQSSGGVVTAETVRRLPLQSLVSGPTGGAVGGERLARELGRDHLICVDMGGTSFDVTLVVNGRADVANEVELEGLPALMPIVRMHTIGAGGGSVAHVEAGGLRVGPRSAGSRPGPACYGAGATEPTVTDANLALGRLDVDRFADGSLRLDAAAAQDALGRVADELGMGTRELAEGVVAVVDAKMAQAIRTLTVEQGIEPRDFTLVAFGGAGPTHAVAIARELEIAEVILPPLPGSFSAWGMLQAEIRRDLVRPFFRHESALEAGELAEAFAELDADAERTLLDEGVPAGAVRVVRFADVRYEGQEYPLTVELAGAPLSAPAVAAAFHAAHETRFGHALPDARVEVVALRVTATGDLGAPGLDVIAYAAGPVARRERPVVFDGEEWPTAIVDRASLLPGDELPGPAIVTEPTTTTVLPPGARALVDAEGLLRIATTGAAVEAVAEGATAGAR